MKVGITFSSFDIVIANNLTLLIELKKQCDYLIVGLLIYPAIATFNKNESSLSVIERYIQLKDSKYVDEIIPYVTKQDIEDVLLSFKIDVCIIVDDCKNKDLKVKEFCIEKGISTHCISKKNRLS